FVESVRRDAARVGRPAEHGPVGPAPPLVIGRVAVVLDPVGRELGLVSGLEIDDPEVVLADEGGVAAVGRGDRITRRGARGWIVGLRLTAIGREITAPDI